MGLTFRPITQWPGPMTAKRKRSAFRAGYSDTLGLLEQELRHLQARHVVLQVAVTEADIRLDGKPRAGAKSAHPGVILSFESKHGPLSYPCDRFDAWEDNLRAIALAMEALRAVDRYGVTRRGEQYKGWTALPPPGDEVAAVLFLHEESGRMPVSTDDERRAAYRAAAMRLHPDRGGDAEKFKRLQQVKTTLGL